MDLLYTPSQTQFREEVRAWLAAHVPAKKLASFDTAEGSSSTGNGKKPWPLAIGVW